tara:strand:- start:678 stop:974 length:297 start_codon:yes stop_codon:yes gene_type:complete
MPKKYVTLSISIFIALFTTLEVVGQNAEKKKKGFIPRYINSIINDTVAQKKSQFFIYPIAGYRPETGVEFGVCPLYVYYAKEDVENRLSEMNAYAFFT